jgi:hypothetical protein
MGYGPRGGSRRMRCVAARGIASRSTDGLPLASMNAEIVRTLPQIPQIVMGLTSKLS